MVELRHHEQKIITVLQKLGGKAAVEQLIAECGFPDATVMRAALTLQEKDLVKISAELQTQIKLTSEGELHAKNGLPERRLIKTVAALGGSTTIDKAAQTAKIEPQFTQIALSWALRKKWAIYDSATKTIRIADQRLHQVVIPEENDEALLNFLCARTQTTLNDLTSELQPAVETLKKRKLLTAEPKTKRILDITHAGSHAALDNKTRTEEVTQLTPELIITGKWRTAKLQKYNIQAPVAKTWAGKKHPYLSFLEEVRTKLVTLGFKEMTGTNVETSFFNFDALYTPQDHPARDEVGIYFIKNPEFGDITPYETAVAKVKATHENGWKTGSTIYLDKRGLQQNVHNIIIAEEDSELHIITGCTTSPHLTKGMHVGISEFFVKRNAKLSFTMIHNWAEDMVVRPRSVGQVEAGGLFLNNYVCMRPVRTLQMYPTTHLIGEGAVARFYSIIVGSPNSEYDVGGRIYLKKPGTRAEIVARAISNGGKIISRGHLIGEVPDIKAHLECKGLILKGGLIHAVPELEGHVDGVEMSHEAAVGKIAQEEICYLMSRGLSEEEATATIVRGFLNVDIPGLPLQLKAEIDKVIEMSEKDVM